ncbi:MAG: hypothetical protein V1875_07480 [Candidatus Altiarchaeota archaeon]
MKFILQLSGEHPTLPLAELKAVLDGQMLEYYVRTEGRLAYVELVDEGAEFVSRLAYTLSAAEEICDAKSVDGLAERLTPPLRGVSGSAFLYPPFLGPDISR